MGFIIQFSQFLFTATSSDNFLKKKKFHDFFFRLSNDIFALCGCPVFRVYASSVHLVRVEIGELRCWQINSAAGKFVEHGARKLPLNMNILCHPSGELSDVS